MLENDRSGVRIFFIAASSLETETLGAIPKVFLMFHEAPVQLSQATIKTLNVELERHGLRLCLFYDPTGAQNWKKLVQMLVLILFNRTMGVFRSLFYSLETGRWYKLHVNLWSLLFYCFGSIIIVPVVWCCHQ
mmetsp:Transcript_2522/g.6706  ORF Transcript_2522/g.6706 Transcript_2522/m.6706 type:complete len:133 (-) Transcript_2522:23-421(-)